MRFEHVNTASEIESVLPYFVADVRHRVFGLSKPLSFYQFYACSAPRRDCCQAYLDRHASEHHSSDLPAHKVIAEGGHAW